MSESLFANRGCRSRDACMNEHWSRSLLILRAIAGWLASEVGLLRGFILHVQCKYEEAVRALENATLANPNNLAAWKFKGVILFKHLQRYDESIEALDRALRLSPRDVNLWSLKGIILSRYLQKYRESIRAFDRALQIDPKDYMVWIHRGDALSALGNRA